MHRTPKRAALAAALSFAMASAAYAADAPAPTPSSNGTGTANAASPEQTAGTLATLGGRWVVDLRPSPDAPKYDKSMVLVISPDRVVSGSFYDSDIEAGRASASNGRLCFAFRTTDGVGPYHTSGCLVGDRILGQTWAEHRKFVLNWSAARE